MIGQNLASKEGSEKNDSEISSIPQNKTEQIFTNSEENAQLKKMLGLNITSSNEKAMNNNFQNIIATIIKIIKIKGLSS